MDNNIYRIFSSQDEKEVKQAFKDLLIKQFESDLETNDCYLFDPEVITDMIHDLYEECINEIREDLKKMIKKQFKDNLSKVNNESIIKVLDIVDKNT